MKSKQDIESILCQIIYSPSKRVMDNIRKFFFIFRTIPEAQKQLLFKSHKLAQTFNKLSSSKQLYSYIISKSKFEFEGLSRYERDINAKQASYYFTSKLFKLAENLIKGSSTMIFIEGVLIEELEYDKSPCIFVKFQQKNMNESKYQLRKAICGLGNQGSGCIVLGSEFEGRAPKKGYDLSNFVVREFKELINKIEQEIMSTEFDFNNKNKNKVIFILTEVVPFLSKVAYSFEQQPRQFLIRIFVEPPKHPHYYLYFQEELHKKSNQKLVLAKVNANKKGFGLEVNQYICQEIYNIFQSKDLKKCNPIQPNKNRLCFMFNYPHLKYAKEKEKVDSNKTQFYALKTRINLMQSGRIKQLGNQIEKRLKIYQCKVIIQIQKVLLQIPINPAPLLFVSLLEVSKVVSNHDLDKLQGKEKKVLLVRLTKDMGVRLKLNESVWNYIKKQMLTKNFKFSLAEEEPVQLFYYIIAIKFQYIDQMFEFCNFIEAGQISYNFF